MYSITDLKKGTLITLDGTSYKVIDYAQKQVGRGGSIVNVKIKNLADGAVLKKTFRGQDKIEPASSSSAAAQYLYADDDSVHFMLTDNYEQVGLPRSVVGEDINYLKEGMETKLIYINSRPLAVELPTKIELEVVEADPGIKGDSAGNVLKNCQVETGLKVQVPLFVKVGDKIRINTNTGVYVDRV